MPLRPRRWTAPLSPLRVLVRLAWVLVVLCAPSPARAAGALAPVTLQLKWTHQFQFAGYYVAADAGYYRDAGLDVRFVEAGETTDVAGEVLAGRADAGIGTTELLLDRARGRPVVVLAVVFQHSALALAVRRDHGIENVHQLAGKRIELEAGSAELRAMLGREGLGDLRPLPHPLGPQHLLDGSVDAASVYSTDEPFRLARAAVPILLLSARASGIDFYGDNLFTTEDQLRRRPAELAAFRAASLRGWRQALAAPAEAIDAVLRRSGTKKERAHLEFEAEKTRTLVMPDVVELGYMYEGRWRHIAETYQELGMLPADVDLRAFLYRTEPPARLPAWVGPAFAGTASGALAVAAFSLVVLRAKRRVARSARELRRFVDGTPIPMVVTSIDDARILYVNDRAELAFGIEGGTAVGLSASDFWASPADRAALVRSACEQGGISDQEANLKRRDGTPFGAMLSTTRSTFEGRPALITGFVDLTERHRMEDELQRASAELNTLRGILPICMYCKKIRDDDGAWEQIERYVARRSEAKFSHGICPDCYGVHFPEDGEAR